MNTDLEGDDSNAKSKHQDIDKETGEPIWKEDPWSGGDTVTKESALSDSPETTRAKVFANIKAKVESISAGAGAAATVTCTVMKVFAAINAVIAAMHIANVVNYITGFLEAIQKTQIGDGGKTELAYYMNSLSERGNTYDASGENIIRESTNSLESPAWNQFFSSGGYVLQSNDEVAAKFNTEEVSISSFKNANLLSGDLLAGIASTSNSIAEYRNCLYAQTATAALDVALAFFTGGLEILLSNFLEVCLIPLLLT